MKKALHLTGNQYSLAASMFYVGASFPAAFPPRLQRAPHGRPQYCWTDTPLPGDAGYLVAQPFFSYMMGRWPAGRVLGISCVLWGVSVLTIVANKNFAHVMVNVRPRSPASQAVLCSVRKPS